MAVKISRPRVALALALAFNSAAPATAQTPSAGEAQRVAAEIMARKPYGSFAFFNTSTWPGLRDDARPALAEKLAKRIEAEGLICAVPQDGALVFLSSPDKNPAVTAKLREVYARARELTRQRGGEGEEPICATERPYQGVMAAHLPDYRVTVFYGIGWDSTEMAFASDHQHRLAMQGLAAEAKTAARAPGGVFLTEADAYVNQYANAAARAIGGDSRYLDAAPDEVKEAVQYLTGMYDPASLKKYAAETGTLPDLVKRRLFSMLMPEQLTYFYDREAAQAALADKTTLSDADVSAVTGKTYLKNADGAAAYLQEMAKVAVRTFTLYRNVWRPEVVEVLETQTNRELAFYKELYLLTRPDSIHWTERDITARLNQGFAGLKASANLNYLFNVKDHLQAVDYYRRTVELSKTVPASLKPMRLKALAGVLESMKASYRSLCAAEPVIPAAASQPMNAGCRL